MTNLIVVDDSVSLHVIGILWKKPAHFGVNQREIAYDRIWTYQNVAGFTCPSWTDEETRFTMMNKQFE